MTNRVKAFLLSLGLLFLTACSGGGSNTVETVTPVISNDETPVVVSPPVATTANAPQLPAELFNYADQTLPNHYIENDFPLIAPGQQAAIELDNTPANNPITNAGATLGRVLFYDKSLSANGTISCGSCHVQAHGFADPNVKSVGFDGGETHRHSMGLANGRFYASGAFFWDERAATLEEQVLMPFQDPIEMGLTLEQLLTLVSEQPYYESLFTDAFGDATVTTTRISQALAQFVRSLVSTGSKYDIARAAVDNPIDDFPGFTAEENAGKDLFFLPSENANGDRADCAGCHISEAFVGPNPPVTVGSTTAVNNGLDATSTDDLGVFETTGDSNDIGKFKAPSLRNIAVRPPYMHDGRFATLEEVIDHYSTGIQPHQNLSPPLIGTDGEPFKFNFTEQEKQQLIAFMRTLTDDSMLTDEKFSDPFPSQPNVLLIIADDIGKDALSAYSEGHLKATTPNLDQIADDGVIFDKFWTSATCSPTRATILTGQYGYRTGVKWASDVLPSGVQTLQSYIDQNAPQDYATAVIGKWHLAGENSSGFNPESLGIDYYAGILGGSSDYYNWALTEDGIRSPQTSYITEGFTDLAIGWIAEQTTPWFLWLAYTASHTPFHVPPAAMHSQGNLADYEDGVDATPYFLAAIEAMDYQIGRLLDSLTESQKHNTVVIFISDNGSPATVAQFPYSRTTAKGSLHQGGINNPMYISGAGVTRRGRDTNVASSVDLFATIAQLTGVESNQYQDSTSFQSRLSSSNPTHRFHYAEMDNGTTDAWTISDGQFKLIETSQGEEQFFDLLTDPYEENDLLIGGLDTTQNDAKAVLEQALTEIRNE